MSDISETVSEKARRGRPTVLPAWYLDQLREQGRDPHNRQSINDYYRFRAIEALGFLDPETRDVAFQKYAWLWNREANDARRPRAIRGVVMTELGRFPDDDMDTMYWAAERICELRPATSHEAAAMVRQWRIP